MFLATVICAITALVGGMPTNEQLEERIVGGWLANIEDYPFQLSLQYKGSKYCGASLISPTLALTAAHCVDHDKNPKSWSIYGGISNLHHKHEGQFSEVTEVNSHPKFNRHTIDYDVCVLRLKTPFNFTDKVKTISLEPIGDDVKKHTMCSVTGWGQLSENATHGVHRLRAVDLPKDMNAGCQELYGSVYNMTSRMTCFGFNKGGKDSCYGDSGGPLVCDGVQFGIVSNGAGCAEALEPSVYTRISNQEIHDFITQYLDGTAPETNPGATPDTDNSSSNESSDSSSSSDNSSDEKS